MAWLSRLFAPRNVPAAMPQPRRRDPSGESYTPSRPALPVAVAWTAGSPALRPDGHCAVAGESFRQQALARAAAAAGPDRHVMAQLCRDRSNPYDSGAVAVFIGGDHVGYIPRSQLGYEGQALYKALARLANAGLPATCWARINGGVPDKPSYGLTLLTSGVDKPDEPFDFPMTVPPSGYAQLLGTESQQLLLSGLLGQRETVNVGVELSVAPAHPFRPVQKGPVVVGRVNGVLVGAMSRAASLPRLPVMQSLCEVGRPASALGRVAPSTGRNGGAICSVSTITVDSA